MNTVYSTSHDSYLHCLFLLSQFPFHITEFSETRYTIWYIAGFVCHHCHSHSHTVLMAMHTSACPLSLYLSLSSQPPAAHSTAAFLPAQHTTQSTHLFTTLLGSVHCYRLTALLFVSSNCRWVSSSSFMKGHVTSIRKHMYMYIYRYMYN